MTPIELEQRMEDIFGNSNPNPPKRKEPIRFKLKDLVYILGFEDHTEIYAVDSIGPLFIKCVSVSNKDKYVYCLQNHLWFPNNY